MKKKAILLCGVVAMFLVLLAVYLHTPRPVIKDPERTELIAIDIYADSYYQDPATAFVWKPETEEDKALAREIVNYLSTCKEYPTLHREVQYHPLEWRGTYILVSEPFRGERGLLLAPSDLDEDMKSFWPHAYDISHGRDFQGELLDPDGIRSYILDALGLPPDYM